MFSLPAMTSAQAPSGTTSLIVKLVGGLLPEEQADVIASNGGIEISTVPALRLHTPRRKLPIV